MSSAPLRFPALKARDLEGTDYVIPRDLPGGPHILIVAFRRWHQILVNAWTSALPEVVERHPGMEVWEIPSLSQGYRMFRSGIDGGMRAGIPDLDVRLHTLTTYTDLGRMARRLGIVSFETIQVFLVDCDGMVLWRGDGEPSTESLAALERAIPDAC